MFYTAWSTNVTEYTNYYKLSCSFSPRNRVRACLPFWISCARLKNTWRVAKHAYGRFFQRDFCIKKKKKIICEFIDSNSLSNTNVIEAFITKKKPRSSQTYILLSDFFFFIKFIVDENNYTSNFTIFSKNITMTHGLKKKKNILYFLSKSVLFFFFKFYKTAFLRSILLLYVNDKHFFTSEHCRNHSWHWN